AVRGGGHAYLSAPYGLYKTLDGYLALAMGDVQKIATTIGLSGDQHQDPSAWFSQRDQILTELGARLRDKETDEWIQLLEAAGIWCGTVHDYNSFLQTEGFSQAGILQEVNLQNGSTLKTTRSVYQIDGQLLYADKPAPQVGQDNEQIGEDYLKN